MKHQRENQMVKPMAGLVNLSTQRLTKAIVGNFSTVVLLFLFLAAVSARAQSIIGFGVTLAQERITVAVSSTNTTTITNAVNLTGGTTNAGFDVSGLPDGASAVLTDTNGNALVYTEMDTNLLMTINTTNVAEGIYVFRLNAGGFDTNNVAVTNSFPFVLQVAHIWNGSLGALGVNSNVWSGATNWLSGVPGATSDVVFGDSNAQTNSFTNSYVDASTTIGSLRFSQTSLTNALSGNVAPRTHTLHINPNVVLTISGTNGFSQLRDYYDENLAGLGAMFVNIEGNAGAKLVISNLTANASLLLNNNSGSTLNLANLDNMTMIVSRFGLADYQHYPNYSDINAALNVGRGTNSLRAFPRNLIETVTLAKTNFITAGYRDPENYTNELTRGYAFTLNNNDLTSSGFMPLLLGISNLFLLDSICFYGGNANGTAQFGPAGGFATFRNTNGTDRVSLFAVADEGGPNAAAQNEKPVLDLSGGTVDLLADRFYVSRDRAQLSTNNTEDVESTVTMGRGKVNVNTAILGFQEHIKPDWTLIGNPEAYLGYCQATLILSSNAFTVNKTLTLGYTADMNDVANAQQYKTRGQITINSGSTLLASNIVADGGLNYYDASQRQNTIRINTGGSLIVSNSIGADHYGLGGYPTFDNAGLPEGLPLDTLTMEASSTLSLHVTTGRTNVYVRTLTSVGSTPGTIKILSLPTFTVYPTNVPLIKYSTATPYLQADVSAVPGFTGQGFILNNASGGTIDLFVTTNASKSLLWVGNPGNNLWDLTTTNWVTVPGGLLTNFAMGDIANFDDSSSITNVSIATLVVPNQSTNGVVITNSTHIYTFSSSGGNIVGTAKVVKSGTNTVIFSASEAGPIAITAGEVDVVGGGGIGAPTLSSNTVLEVISGTVNGNLAATAATVTNSSVSTINGSISLASGSSFVNSGAINISGSGNLFSINSGSVFTNKSSGNIALHDASNPAGEVFAGSTLANFGVLTVQGGRLALDGTFFGTGQFFDDLFPSTSGSIGRLQVNNVTTAFLSPGATPNNSIGDMLMGVRVDMHASNPQNNAGTFLVEVDTVNNTNDTLHCARWNNIGCIWAMTNLTGSFASGQSFRVLVNLNGPTVTNLVDTLDIWPLMQPTVPGPGLQWNLSGIQTYGIVAVTNSSMIWDGSGDTIWGTNSASANNWKNTVPASVLFGDNQGAILDDRATGSRTITLTTKVAPAGYNRVDPGNVAPNIPAFMPGLIVSNSTGDYTIVGGGPTTTNGISGATSIYKAGPGTLTLLTTNDFTGGMIIEGGTVAFSNNLALGFNGNIPGQRPAYNQCIINGGTLKDFATNSLSLQNALNMTIKENGATFEVSSNGALLTQNNAMIGPGGLTKTGAGVLSLTQTGNTYTNGTMVNEGTLRLTAAAASSGGITLNNNATLELSGNLTIPNAINIAGGATVVSLLGVNNNSTSSGSWSGSGSVTFVNTNNGDLFTFTAAMNNFSGTMSFGTSSNIFRFNGSTNSNNCLGSANATFDLGAGAAKLGNLNGAGLTYDLGSLSGGANTVLTGRTSTNSSAVNGETYSIGANGSDSIFSGTITNGLPYNAVGSDPVSIVKVGSGKLLLNGVSTYTGNTTVSNGVLGGTGSIASALTVLTNATLSPAASVGTFTVNSNVTLFGNVLMEINQSTSPKNDLLVVTGTLTGGGDLVVTNLGPDIINGSKFTLFSQLVTGFASVTLPNTPAYSWQNDLAVDGSITLISGGVTVNTNAFTITNSTAAGVLTLSWPLDHTGWSLQSQTNPLAVGLRTNWFDVSGSTSTNTISFPMDVNAGSIFYRMIFNP